VMPRNLALALSDLMEGALKAEVWSMLAWQEVKQRYRRSTLGPFWLTLSAGILIAAMGPLYAKLFGQDFGIYFPFVAIGFIVWQLLAAILVDSGQTFIAAEDYLKQVRLPVTVHVLRMVWRNLIIFAHNIVIVAVVLFFFPPKPGWEILLVPFGVLAIAVNGVWVGAVVGMVSARFRDIPQIIGSVVQVFFFLTPVLWRAEMLGRHQWAADLNPLYHFLEVVRAPLLGVPTNPLSWPVVLGVTVIGFAVTLMFLTRYRNRIAYWV
jgi:ABC-type polysaccharide/polyol phosphate export permease